MKVTSRQTMTSGVGHLEENVLWRGRNSEVLSENVPSLLDHIWCNSICPNSLLWRVVKVRQGLSMTFFQEEYEKGKNWPPKPLRKVVYHLRTFFRLIFVEFDQNHKCLSWDVQPLCSLRHTKATKQQRDLKVSPKNTDIPKISLWTWANNFKALWLYMHRCSYTSLFFRLTLS